MHNYVFLCILYILIKINIPDSCQRIFIGIDDTDNLNTRGTGFRVRELGNRLQTQSLCEIEGITRHQLLFDSRIPYTSHNSSACMAVLIHPSCTQPVVNFCREYLAAESADGSDVGLCICSEKDIPVEIIKWGRRAKATILTKAEGYRIADQADIFLQGLTGDHGGIIGALAAVGLRAAGNDGRFIGLQGIREISPGNYSSSDILRMTGIDCIRNQEGTFVDAESSIEINNWLRPVLLGGKAVLLVEKTDEQKSDAWRIARREIIKQF